MTRVVVTGAAGFIGHHLCRYLRARGYLVRGVDIRAPEHFSDQVADSQYFGPDNDLRDPDTARYLLRDMDQVYALAADMGGAGYLFVGDYDWDILRNNTLITLNTLRAAEAAGVKRVLYTSSACVYQTFKQDLPDAPPLREDDVYPAMPDHDYGWEKLYSERLCQAFGRATGIPVRVARFHNIYGPEGSWNDGREKVPAAACRKVAQAKRTGGPVVEVWGDGEQVRSFCYIDDCLEILHRLMESDHGEPINVGTDEAVSVNELFAMVAGIAGFEIEIRHVPGPLGVKSRNADLTRMRAVLGYEPRVGLRAGMAELYRWVEEQLRG